VRKWFKKLISEAIIENFPPMHISIQDRDDGFKILKLESCIFTNGTVRIGNIDKKEVDISNCTIEVMEQIFIADLETEKKL
jgi:hypothetical protein